MSNLPTALRLPAATFLCGGPQAFRTELANILADITHGAQAHSFAAPIRDGALGTFFSGDPSIDIAELSAQPILPEPNCPTFGAFVSAYSQFLAAFFSDPAIIGRLTSRRVEENLHYFHSFIFDDADQKENIRLIADMFGRDQCLILNCGTPHLSSQTIPVLTLPATTTDVSTAIAFLAQRFSSSPSTIPSPILPSLPENFNDLL